MPITVAFKVLVFLTPKINFKTLTLSGRKNSKAAKRANQRPESFSRVLFDARYESLSPRPCSLYRHELSSEGSVYVAVEDFEAVFH